MNEQEITQLIQETIQAQIDKLQSQLDALRNNATIPYEIGEAFKARVLTDVSPVATSGKGASTENVSINEAGISTHTVLGAPDGFVQATINGTVYYIPYFSS